MHYDFNVCDSLRYLHIKLISAYTYKYLLYDLTRLPFHWIQIPGSAKYRKTNTNIEQNDKEIQIICHNVDANKIQQ